MEDADTVVFNVDWPLIIGTVISVILPLLVGLVTKTYTSRALKAILLAALAFITSGLTELYAAITGGEVFDAGTWLVGAIASFAIAVGSQFGFWRPVGATAAVQAVGDRPKAPDVPPGPQI